MKNLFSSNFEIIQEGAARVLVPDLAAFKTRPSEYAPSSAPVFYNPVMELNRDIAVLVLQTYQKQLNHDLVICEPLTGSGIRGIRIASEIENIQHIVLNDISIKAFQLASHNVSLAKLDEKITVKNEDANYLLRSYAAPYKRFDYVDIDPFGSPVRHLDSAIHALRNGGLLALTATDMAPLCGVHPKACIRKYGGKPLRTEYCHELAIRLLSGSLATVAAKYNISIDVLFSYKQAHYIRLYAIIHSGAKKADETLKNIGYIQHCFSCFHREILMGLFPNNYAKQCINCSSKMSVAGPLWLGQIADKTFCEKMIEEIDPDHLNKKKIQRLLLKIKNELEGPITFFSLDKLCDSLNFPVPPIQRFIQFLRDEKFAAFSTHFDPTGIRFVGSSEEIKRLLTLYVNERSWMK